MWVAGRFELLQLLGSGSSGTVHAAHDHQQQRLVALKLWRPTAGETTEQAAEAKARFSTEASRVQQLRHADIVTVFESGEDQGQTWLAMEAVPGVDLTRYTSRQRLLPEPLVLRLGERLAAALAHAHGVGVVHRDLKPGNVLAHWPSDTLKIVDFGLARTADAQATRTGLVLGTPAYMAPELLAGALPDARSDFYALGALLFQLLTGRLPFEDSKLGDRLRRVATEPAPDLRSLQPQTPAALAELVAALLERQAARRAHDGPALAAALRRLREAWPGGLKSR